MDIRRSEVMGTCLFCRTFLHPRIGNAECFVVGMEPICDACMEKLAEAWRRFKGTSEPEPAAEVAAEQSTQAVRVCQVCGEEFDNVGKYLAHTKKCRAKEAAE